MTSPTGSPPPDIPSATAAPAAATSDDGPGGTPMPAEPPRVFVSPSFGRIMAERQLSLLVSTYDTGKVFLLRATERGVNVHFVGFPRAMGIAVNRERLYIGSKNRVHELYNMPALIPRVPPPEIEGGQYDACYVPRTDYFTGDIDIHEMAFAGDKLWCVNTRFSCLCTIDRPYSFEPRWRPPWITGLSSDDRCHLNGLAVVDGRVAYATAFATSDTHEGWRPTKSTSGLVMEVPSGRILAQGFSMPHSPRFYARHVWVLNSGHGTVAVVDPATGTAREIAQMSGFTRGLDFSGNIAFVGLSRVRENKVFGGTPLTDRIPEAERFCGVQALDVSTGKIVGFVRFESGVNEIFSVKVLPEGIAFPHILEFNDPLVDSCYALSDTAMRDVRPAPAAAGA